MSFLQDRIGIKAGCCAIVFAACAPGHAFAHASEQGFVLLLPTEVYIRAGVAAVALTVLALFLMPGSVLVRLYQPVRVWRLGRANWHVASSCAAAVFLFLLVVLGQTGPRDPLTNPLPLAIWTVWWVALIAVQGMIGNVWRWLDPWTGPVSLCQPLLGGFRLRYPLMLGHWIGVIGFLGFAGFLLADPAPSDPARLASIVALYWCVNFAGEMIFGPRWRHRANFVPMLMHIYARAAIFGPVRGGAGMGVSGWKVAGLRSLPLALAMFCLLLLGSGSFDGLNETFWYLDLIGVNPLEFPGRSAVILPNLLGLLLANAALIGVFAIAVWLGMVLARDRGSILSAIRLFAPAVLPIALGYHVAHYLTSFLVDGQYVIAAINDPLASGADLLSIAPFYVTTGFFNTQDSVRTIWLTQAGAVVIGHVLSVMLSHRLALGRYGDGKHAAISQLPLAVFMIAYTFFGLWLLAAPRGF